jgi:hypothetical protein
MAYTAGDTILDDEYNSFAASSSSPYGINHMIGTGSGEYGLGQTTISTVTAGNTVTAAQWNSLFGAMDNLANHAEVSLTSTTAKAAGDNVAIISALQTDLASLATAVAAGCPSASGGLTQSGALQNADSSTRWTGSHVSELTTNFSSGNEMRWFFNAGGKIQIDTSRIGNGGSSATSKDNSLSELVTGLGRLAIGSKESTRSGTTETVSTNGLALGYHDLTTSYQTIIRLTQDGGSYTSMYLDIQAKLNGAVGTATAITVRVEFNDPDGGDGTFTSGNTSGVDQYANFIGQTRHTLLTLNPNTTNGLTTAYVPSSTAVTSNSTS